MIGWIILALVLLFLAVILIRTAAFTPKAESRAAAEPVSYDKDAVLHALAELVKLPHGLLRRSRAGGRCGV